MFLFPGFYGTGSVSTRIVSLANESYPCIVTPEPSFHVVGISHHTAKVELREGLALGRAETAALLREERLAGRTAVVLSTCNRFEYYWSGEQEGESWLRSLAQSRGVSEAAELLRLDGTPAIRHLFRVTAGLDSQVLGESEILGQVRRAYDAARAEGTTTREMDLILSAALAAGRRVRRETVLGHHPASVSSAAVGLMAERWGGIGARVVVVVGAGEAAEGTLRALHERGATAVTLLSRRPEHSRALAQAWGAAVAGADQLPAAVEAADLLIVATSSAYPVVTQAELARVMASRANRELCIIDLGIPRNVEPPIRTLSGVELFDLDDLQRLCCPAAGTVTEAFLQAERVVEDELARLGLSLRGQALAPHLAELHRLGVQLAEEESNWALNQLGNIPESQRDVVRQMADRLVRRVLYPVSRNLRSE